MAEPHGHAIALSPARQIVVETMLHSQRLPLLPCSRQVNLAPVVEARRNHATPPSWSALFIKAYGIASQRHPELRRSAVPWPWLHLYEHPNSNAVIPVERELDGERVVLMAKIMHPESLPVAHIDELLCSFRDLPVEQVSHFRQLLRLGRLPWSIRRFVFWQTLNLSGYKKAKRFGTFSISSVGNLGAEIDHAWTPLTTYMTFGPIAANGCCTLRIIFDHRVMDARTVARCLQSIEEVLTIELVEELKASRQRLAA